MKVSINIFLAMTCLVPFKANAYDHKNQASWYDLDNAECHMDHQSPIELSSYKSSLCFGVSSIYFKNFHLPYEKPAVLWNNGHTADMHLPKTDFISISGGPFSKNMYFPTSIHFHWGSENNHGSEHVVDNKRYSMEMHIVHLNSKYESIHEALSHKDGIAVLAIFYDVEPSKKTDFVGLNQVTDSLADIEQYNSSTEVYGLTLSELFGNINTNDFFTYKGSLTTPPCSEAVTWVVFRQPINFSPNQMSRFRLLSDEHGDVLQNNYRHLHPSALRKVCRRYWF